MIEMGLTHSIFVLVVKDGRAGRGVRVPVAVRVAGALGAHLDGGVPRLAGVVLARAVCVAGAMPVGVERARERARGRGRGRAGGGGAAGIAEWFTRPLDLCWTDFGIGG